MRPSGRFFFLSPLLSLLRNWLERVRHRYDWLGASYLVAPLKSARCADSRAGTMWSEKPLERGVKNLTAIAVAGLLAGCASTNVEEMRGPSGDAMKSVKCVSDSGKCMAMASESCGSGPYQVLDSSSNAGGALADFMPGPFTWYRMQYVCGRSDGKMPTFAHRGSNFVAPPIVMPNPASRPMPTTTNCQQFGNQVRCSTY